MQIIALKKELEIGNTGATANHWVVTSFRNDPINDFAVVRIVGYNSRADRIAGKDRIQGAKYKFIIENTYDEQGVIVDRHYNKFKNHMIVDGKHQQIWKSALLEYLRTIPDFSDALDD